jgi:hypothetical protein
MSVMLNENAAVTAGIKLTNRAAGDGLAATLTRDVRPCPCEAGWSALFDVLPSKRLKQAPGLRLPWTAAQR